MMPGYVAYILSSLAVCLSAIIFFHLKENHGFDWSWKIIICLVLDVILIIVLWHACVVSHNRIVDDYYQELADEVEGGDMEEYAGTVHAIFVDGESIEEYNPEYVQEAIEALCDYYYRADETLRNFRKYEYHPE